MGKVSLQSTDEIGIIMVDRHTSRRLVKQMEEKWQMGNWFSGIEERQRKEILWAMEYDQPQFRHGTVGHNQLMIIAKLARLLNEMERMAKE